MGCETRTLLCLGSERLVEVVCHRVKDICVDLLFCVRMEKYNLHRPVTEWKAFNATVRTRAVDCALVVVRIRCRCRAGRAAKRTI